jgi:hypothetical protein
MIDLRDDLEIIGLDSLSISCVRCKESSTFDDVMENVLKSLVQEEREKEARCLLTKLKSLESLIKPLTNVICLRLMDVLLSFMPIDKNNSALQLTILSMIEKYYGKHHPRSVLQMIRTALMMEDDNMKIKLLNRGLSQAQMVIPVSEGRPNIGSDIKQSQEFPSMLSVIESLIRDVQEGIKCEVSIKNMKNKWKKDEVLKAPQIQSNDLSRGFLFPCSFKRTSSNFRGTRMRSKRLTCY